MTNTEAKLLKQIEYYFGDLNLVKDKHLKALIEKSNDGWVSYDELLKFPRLKSISEDKEFIQTVIKNSSSSIVEASDEGIRRIGSSELPENIQMITDMHMDKSVYVKGFNNSETIDSIIEYLETNGGPTMNVHMRRIVKGKVFKGSIFAIFKAVEDAEKFLNNEDAAKYKNSDMIRMWQKEYLSVKKNEYEERQKEKDIRQKEALACKEALLLSKMTPGALIELSFVEKTDVNTETEKGDFSDNKDERAATKSLKPWLTELLVDVAPVAWVEYFPLSKKIIVRMGKENSAESALKALCESKFKNESKSGFIYQIYEFTGVVLEDEKERDYWRNILSEQGQKRKRKDNRNAGGPNRKRMRR